MDISYLLLLQSFREATMGIFNTLFGIISDYAKRIFCMMVFAGVYWCIHKKAGILAAFGYSFSLVINSIIKTFAAVLRPSVLDSRLKPIGKPSGYSFPSGHVMRAVGLYGAFAFSLRKYVSLRNFFIVLIILIAFSRNYVGHHTPQDVISGAIFGVLSLYLVYKMLNWAEKSKNADIAVLIIGIVASAAAVLYAFFKQYPAELTDLIKDCRIEMQLDSLVSAGYVLGTVVGWFLEKRFVRFSVDGTPAEKLMRYFIGAAGLLIINYPVSKLITKLLNDYSGEFIKGFLLLFYIMFVFPLFIKKSQEKA